jgi:muramoyltetrapeptide carboxypeptidase
VTVSPPPGDGALRRPRALHSGDHVAVLTASSPANADRLEIGLDALRFAGLEPVVYASAREPGTLRHYLAGTEALRACDLRAALLDDSIAGVLVASGGYGAQRTLEVMDWTGLDAVAPKVVVGYSDVTAVLEALAAKLGWTSLMGPMVSEPEFAEAYSFTSLQRCLMAPERVGTLRFDGGVAIVGGSARGRTAGGNLSRVASSVGTDTSWRPHDAIVLLEDEDEDDGRIDGMLTQLRRSGYLDTAVAVIAGTWHNCGPVDSIHPVLVDRLGDLGVPVLAWANLGHGGHVQTFPIGVRAELDADARALRFLEPPLEP